MTRALFVELTTLKALIPGMALGAVALAAGVAALACALASYRIVRLEPSAVLRRS